ncbi:hypothetical protein NLX86_13360 [Streptomyces sp. A3M-1-3]|nr:hypothetical protein [Streptomyces sp. A3M-1-3]MCP3819066.1 hypothetical protein [Streptomyces sp. A3M-1-3]
MLKATVDTNVRVNGWANTAITRIQKRYEAKDRGQTAFEYLGIILVVVAIIGGIAATGIGGAIQARIAGLVATITAGE